MSDTIRAWVFVAAVATLVVEGCPSDNDRIADCASACATKFTPARRSMSVQVGGGDWGVPVYECRCYDALPAGDAR